MWRIRGKSLLKLLPLLLSLLIYFKFYDRVLNLLHPINYPLNYVSSKKDEFFRFLGSSLEGIWEIRTLREEVKKLRLERDELRAYKSFEKFCKNLSLRVGVVLDYDRSGYDRFLLIYGGREEGIRKNSVVVADGLILGKVKEVFKNFSKVYTVYNDRLTFLAYSPKTKKIYIYKGGFPLGRLLYVGKDDNLKRGDEILIRVKGVRLREFPLGKVEEVKEGDDPFFKEVLIRPLIDVRKQERVLILSLP